MFRLLAGAILIATLATPDVASAASALKTAAPSVSDSDLSAARRCVCTVQRTSHVRVVRRHSKRVAVRLPLRIGYDPLPYRYGYYVPPYRYIDRYAVVRARPAVYR
jgi:hypothetical protein